jgi:hypothetical protein
LPDGAYLTEIVTQIHGAIVSHPIPLHTVERLERALDASLQRVAARGPREWVRRIVAFFFCQYCEAVIGLLEGLLAEYRAGTLVFPDRVDDASTIPAEYKTPKRRAAASRPRGPAVRRVRAGGCADTDEPAGAPGQSAAQDATLALRRPVLIVSAIVSTPHPPIRRPGSGPRGVAGYPSVVPRPSITKFDSGKLRQRTPFSLRYHIVPASPTS